MSGESCYQLECCLSLKMLSFTSRRLILLILNLSLWGGSSHDRRLNWTDGVSGKRLCELLMSDFC